MNKLAVIVALLLTFANVSAKAKDISVNGIRMNATIIDVRTADEFAGGHVDGAINIPVDQLEEKIRSVPGLKKDDQILVYCRSGRRSAIGKEILQKMGFRKIHDGGGFDSLTKVLKTCTAASC